MKENVQEQIIPVESSPGSTKEQQLVDKKEEKSSKKDKPITPESIAKKEKLITSLTIANAMMGFIFKRIGWALGLVAIICCGLYSLYGYKIVIKASQSINSGNMRIIIQTFLGKWVSILIDVAVCLEFIGYLICYVSVVGDYFRIAIFNFSGANAESWYIKLAFGVILFGLSIIKSLDCFSKISSFSILFILLTVLSTVVYCIIAHVNGTFEFNKYDDATQQDNIIPDQPVPNWLDLVGPENKNWGFAILEFFMRLPVFQTLFGQYACVTGIYHDMQSPAKLKPKVLDFSTTLSTVFAIVLYSVMAISANSMFGRDAASNVLLNFSPKETWMTICRLLCCFSVSVSYVLILYSVRHVVLSWLPFKEGTKKYNLSFYLTGLCVVIITTGLSILIPNIETVLNFISAVFGCVWYTLLVCMLIYVVPKIRAANCDREIQELKGEDKEKEKEQVVLDIRKSLDIIARRSSFVYDIANEEEQKKVNEVQQNLNRTSVNLNIIEARKSIQSMQSQDKEEKDQTVDVQQADVQQELHVVVAQEQIEDQSDSKSEQDQESKQTLEKAQEELKLLEIKDKELAKMNCSRKVWFGIAMGILIAINLESLILGTFFDMTTDDRFN